MNELFDLLEAETSKHFGVNSVSLTPEIVHGVNVFEGLPSSTRKVIRKETVFVNGKKHVVRRVFIRMYQPQYQNVGWVMYSDIHSCMICSKPFMRIVGKKQKRHCKICGNIVCVNCLTGCVKVKEFSSLLVDACSICYFGQEEISILPELHAANESTNSLVDMEKERERLRQEELREEYIRKLIRMEIAQPSPSTQETDPTTSDNLPNFSLTEANPPVATNSASAFLDCLDIEEYDGVVATTPDQLEHEKAEDLNESGGNGEECAEMTDQDVMDQMNLVLLLTTLSMAYSSDQSNITSQPPVPIPYSETMCKFILDDSCISDDNGGGSNSRQDSSDTIA